MATQANTMNNASERAAERAANRSMEKLNDAKSSLRTAAEEGAHAVTDIAYRAGENLRHCLTNSRDQVNRAVDTYSDSVRQHPVRTSLLAMGAGFLLAALLRR